MNGIRVPMFLSVDVEPDENVDIGRSGPVSWTGCPALARHIDVLRDALAAEAHPPVAVGWYLRMDPQIEALTGTVDGTADRFDELIGLHDDDYLGLHVHRTRWDVPTDSWVIDEDQDLWLDHLRVGLDAYWKRLGAAPLRHRFTDIPSLTRAMVETLVDAGVAVDLTIEPRPGSRWFARTPNGVALPTRKQPLAVICGTSGPAWGPRTTAWRRAKQQVRRRLQRRYLNPYWGAVAPRQYWDEVARAVEGMRRQKCNVSIGLRTDPEGSAAGERIQALLSEFARHPIRERVRFADPLEFSRIRQSEPNIFSIRS